MKGLICPREVGLKFQQLSIDLNIKFEACAVLNDKFPIILHLFYQQGIHRT